MIREALEFLSDQAKRAASVGRFMIVNDVVRVWDGEQWQEMEMDNVPIRHVVNSLESFEAAARTFGLGGSIWHDEEQVVLLLESGRETVRLPLELSPQWTTFVSTHQPKSPFEARKFLRRELAGCVQDGLPHLFGKITFTSDRTGTHQDEGQKQHLGRSVEQAVQGTAELPDEIKLTVWMYVTPGVKISLPVVMAADILYEREAFHFYPIPGEVETATAATQSILHDRLLQTELPVFYGRPSCGVRMPVLDAQLAGRVALDS